MTTYPTTSEVQNATIDQACYWWSVLPAGTTPETTALMDAIFVKMYTPAAR
jgi:hypothetical protein